LPTQKLLQKGIPLFEFKVTDWKAFEDELNKFYAENKNIPEIAKEPKVEGEF
jgi:hypothetical protein